MATQLVAEQFPDLSGAPVELLATGWDNTVFVVDRTWAFRFPRRTVALPLQERELRVLPQVAPLLPLPVPVPERLGRATDRFPWPFTGARLLPGRELATAGLADDAREPAARALGELLRVLHAVELDIDLPVDPNERARPAARLERSAPAFARLAAAGLWQPDERTRRRLDDARRLSPPTGTPVLCHGDLHVRHLLVDDAGAACGLIDWGDVCRADPAVDLSIAYAAFTGTARAAMLDAYGAVDPERELRARVLAVSLSAALADAAAAQGDEALLHEALTGLRRAVQP